MQKLEIKNYTLIELKKIIESLGLKSFKANQIFNWLYDKGVFDFSNMTNISKIDRDILSKKFSIYIPDIPYLLKSQDGTIKFAIKLIDNELVESVLIPDEDRLTLCLSTQVGCKMGCKFCLTGKKKFKRNLNVSEIIDQLLIAKFKILKKEKRITNIVFMGMGEPLDNYDNLEKSLQILTDDHGFNFSTRKITVSTCGIPDKILKLGENFDVNLAISLHAPTNEKRIQIMPIAKKYNLQSIIETCKNYPMKNRQRITFEYIMLENFNDSTKDAKNLVKLLSNIKSKVNLIPFNTYKNCEFNPSPAEQIEKFRQFLIKKGITATTRKSKGSDILAACGQLYGKE